MKKLYTLLFTLAILITAISTTFAQRVFIGEDLDNGVTTEVISVKGDEAYCMVTGGAGGNTGWSKFYLWSTTTTFDNIAPKPSGMYFLGGDFGPDGTWYATEWAGGLYTVDTETGEYAELANLGETVVGITYSPAYETWFCATGDKLFTLDMSTYTLTEVGPIGNAGSMTGIGADIRGNLYGIDINDDQLYKIDPVTGIGTGLGTSGYDFDYLQNCTYDKNMDIMYHAGFWVAPSVNGALYTYDLTNGAATEFSAFPNDEEVTAFAIPWDMPAHGAISGVVTDAATGDPVQDVEVYLVPAGNDDLTNILKITGNDGAYQMGVVLPGTYEIMAVSGNYGTVVIGDIVVNEDANLTYNIELEIAPYTATFQVLAQDGGEVLEGAEVEFLGQIKHTDAAGEATFENIAAGTHSYTAYFPGMYQGFGDVVVIDGDVTEQVYLYTENNVTIDLVLIEEATATWCGPCGQMAPMIDEIYEGGAPICIIAYHSSDPYANNNSNMRNGFYGVTAYPTFTFMGMDQCNNVPQATVEAMIAGVQDLQTSILMEISNTAINEVSNSVTGTIAIEHRAPLASDAMTLQVALVENHIPEQWQGNDELNFVERTMFPDANGTNLDLTVPGTTSVDFELSLNDVLDPANCQIVYFVQDNFAKEVYNSNKLDVNTITSIEEHNNDILHIGPNPTTEQLNIQTVSTIESIEIFNTSGAMVERINGENNTEMCLKTAHLKTGMYLLRIQKEGSVWTTKFLKK